MTRKRSTYRPRLVSIPVMKEMHDQIAMGMHTALAALERDPGENAFSMLASIFNMVGLAIDGDARFDVEMLQVKSGSRAMNQIGAKEGPLRALPLELLPVRNAVNTIDALLPRLNIWGLHHANVQMRGMK